MKTSSLDNECPTRVARNAEALARAFGLPPTTGRHAYLTGLFWDAPLKSAAAVLPDPVLEAIRTHQERRDRTALPQLARIVEMAAAR